MKTKLVLFIGPDFGHDFTRDILRKRATYRCIFVKDEIVGLAVAFVKQPDIVICRRKSCLLPSGYMKFWLKHALESCRFFVFSSNFKGKSK